jgi:RES domain-containing protein
MRVFRISRAQHAREALSGRGGLLAAGRWHARGTRIVYTSATLSLAALEVLVHADKDLLPGDLVHVEIEVPDDLVLERIQPRNLPRSWRAYPAPGRLRVLGAQWIERNKSAVLQVPSAVIPQESNFLLNPARQEARFISVVAVEKFVFDPRLTL